ncbi:MAG: aspartyl protease family protein [Vulcanimicrobiaceae bacterium]
MRFAAALLLVFSLALADTAFASAATRAPAALAALLARIRAADGGAGAEHLVAQLATRDPRERVTLELDGLAFASTRCLGSLCTGSFAQGPRAWTVDPNGDAFPLEASVDPLQATLRALIAGAFAEPAFTQAGGSVAFEGSAEESAAAPDEVLRVTAPGGEPLDALVDPRSGVLLSAREAGPGGQTLRFFDRRAFAGGGVVPFALDADGVPLVRLTKVERAAQPLTMPAGIVPSFADGAVRLPLVAESSGLPVVDCALGGIAIRCLLDTGNSGLAIGLQLAERLGLEPLSSAYEIAGVGRYATGVVRAPALSLGSVTEPPSLYIVLDDLGDVGFDVILGADAFAHATVTLDQASGYVTLAPQDAPLPANGTAIPLAFRDEVPVVSAALGALGASLLIDSGDQATVDLGAPYLARHPGIVTQSGTATVAGTGGSHPAILGTVARLQLGPLAFDDLPAIVAVSDAPTGEGHLGDGFLRRFRAIFAYARSRLVLVPLAAPTSPASSAPR